MSVLLLRADARALPLPDASVDLIVTSPPYYALRSYTDGGQHYDGQIGSEPTPGEYIDSLIVCTREWMRVLKPAGSIFVDLGDKYGRPGGGADRNPRSLTNAGRGTTERMRTPSGGRDKCLMLLPERYRVACVDQLGLIARAVICWSKPNGLPESVIDRVRRSHEDWVHLVKQPRYYSAIDHIRQPHSSKPTDKGANCLAGQRSLKPVGPNSGAYNPLGALPGSVWEIPNEPLTVPDHLGVDHFAAFPTEWPRRIILGWSPSGICTACGEGRRPVLSKDYEHRQNRFGNRFADGLAEMGIHGRARPGSSAAPDLKLTATITGEACACTPSYLAAGQNADHLDDWRPPSTRPGIIVDPFGGTGTTALVAHALGRTGISVDMSADYCRLARWRTSDPGELAKAMRVEKPAKQLDGQADLLADLLEGPAA